MSIIYTIIVRDYENILCEYTEYHGTFEQYTQKLIKKTNNIPKATIIFKEYFFHYITNGNLLYMCMTENNYPIDTAFEYLDVIKDNFEITFTKSQIIKAYNYSFNKNFQYIIESKMNYYNKNTLTKSENQLKLLQDGLIKTQTELLNSQDILEERNEKIQLIVSKAEQMKKESLSFHKGAKKLKNKVRKRILIYKILSILIIVVLIVFLIWRFII